MKENLFAFLDTIHPLSEELKSQLAFYLKTREFKKKSYLLKEGQVCDYIYFIELGLVRSFYTKNGNEICSWFMKENDVIISVDSFYRRKPSNEFVEAIEDTIVHYIHYDELQSLYKKFIEFNIIGRVLTEKYYQLSEERLFSIRKQQAAERYSYLLKYHPELLQRVARTYIASYLGISLETLSRVHKK